MTYMLRGAGRGTFHIPIVQLGEEDGNSVFSSEIAEGH